MCKKEQSQEKEVDEWRLEEFFACIEEAPGFPSDVEEIEKDYVSDEE